MTTSWTRSRAPSFIRILETCVLAVRRAEAERVGDLSAGQARGD